MPVLDAWSVGRSPVTLSSKVMGGIIPSPASPRRRGQGLGRSPMGDGYRPHLDLRVGNITYLRLSNLFRRKLPLL